MTDETLDGLARSTFLKLQEGSDFVRPMLWKDHLTPQQRGAVHIIDHYDQYTTEMRVEVDLRLTQMPLVSINAESRLGEEYPFTAQIAFVHSLISYSAVQK